MVYPGSQHDIIATIRNLGLFHMLIRQIAPKGFEWRITKGVMVILGRYFHAAFLLGSFLFWGDALGIGILDLFEAYRHDLSY